MESRVNDLVPVRLVFGRSFCAVNKRRYFASLNTTLNGNYPSRHGVTKPVGLKSLCDAARLRQHPSQDWSTVSGRRLRVSSNNRAGEDGAAKILVSCSDDYRLFVGVIGDAPERVLASVFKNQSYCIGQILPRFS